METGDLDGTRTPVALRAHRVHWFAGRTHEVLDDLAASPAWALTVAERRETIAELVALKDRVDGLLLDVVAEADHADDATACGATTTAALVRGATRLTGAEATRLVRDATTLQAHDPVRVALAAGAIRREQAMVIAAAVDALPDEVHDRREAAEAHLLAEAATHDAKTLRGLGTYLLEVIAPDQADALIAHALDREEARARRTASLTTWDDGHGSTHGKFKLPHLHGHLLRTLVEAIANPAVKDPIPRERSASPQVYGEALCRLLEAIPPGWVPTSGGVNATIVVTMPYDTLLGGLKAAKVLGTDQRLSPGAARHLAAKTGIIPAVLGGPSQVLDLGRQRRLHSKPQRLAMAIRQDGYCNIKDCPRPATWCHGHHRKPWTQGGLTSLDNGELPCARHHTLIHQGFDYPRRT